MPYAIFVFKCNYKNRFCYKNSITALKTTHTIKHARRHDSRRTSFRHNVRTLDAEALERVLWKITPGTLELKNITTSNRTQCNLTNINTGMKFEKLAHGWWVDNALGIYADTECTPRSTALVHCCMC